jgi:hypothetical protein
MEVPVSGNQRREIAYHGRIEAIRCRPGVGSSLVCNFICLANEVIDPEGTRPASSSREGISPRFQEAEMRDRAWIKWERRNVREEGQAREGAGCGFVTHQPARTTGNRALCFRFASGFGLIGRLCGLAY